MFSVPNLATLTLVLLDLAVLGSAIDPAFTIPSSYAPTSRACPSTPLIRSTNASSVLQLSAAEQAWIAKRDAVTSPLWTSYLNGTGVWTSGSAPAGFVPPRVSLAVSGGGLRAMTYGASVLSQLDSRITPAPVHAGVLQLATYFAGLSGGSWLVSLMYLNDFPAMTNLTLLNTWDPQFDLLTPDGDIGDSTIHRFVDSIGFYKNVLDGVEAKDNAGYPVGLTDFWAGLIAAHLPPNVASAGNDSTSAFTPPFSQIANTVPVANASVPLPFLTTCQRSAGETQVSVLSNVWEISPFEVGSANNAVRSFIQTAYLGTNMSIGSPTQSTCTTNLDQTAFLSGASSSLFNIPLAALATDSSAFTLISDLAKKITGAGEDTAEFPNPFAALPAVNASISSASTIRLVDGGEGGQNIPLRPMLARSDVVIAVDGSADTTYNYPNATSIIVSAQYSVWMDDPVDSFPPVPKTPDAFVAQGLNTRVAVFGCGAAVNASDTYKGPVIIYVPNSAPGANLTTYTFDFTAAETTAFFDGAPAAVSGGLSSADAATCFACALLAPSFRNNTALLAQSSKCQTCLSSWCWNGSTEGEPGWVGVPATKNYNGVSFPPPLISSGIPLSLFENAAVTNRVGGRAAVLASAVLVAFLLI
ncbi:Lysophospholipase 1 [Thoreauomyces humboldtii]|nr:Lysophospholipase 1 [Thoreauomyces humboldtii]